MTHEELNKQKFEKLKRALWLLHSALTRINCGASVLGVRQQLEDILENFDEDTQ